MVVVIAGSALTLYYAQRPIERWAKSGQRFALGTWWEIDLEAGKSLVYYESPAEIPVNFVTLTVVDAHDRAMGVVLTGGTDDYVVDGTNGAALFEMEIDAPGPYLVICNDAAADSFSSAPETDRIVIGKSPNTKADALGRRRTIHLIGAGITLTVAIILYIIHGLAQRPPNQLPPRRFVAQLGEPEL